MPSVTTRSWAAARERGEVPRVTSTMDAQFKGWSAVGWPFGKHARVGPMENVDARLHVMAQMVNVVKTDRRIFEFHRQNMRSGLAVRETQHGVRRQTRHEVERAQGFGHPVDFQGQRQSVHPFACIVLDSDLKRSRLVCQGEWGVKPDGINPDIGHVVGCDGQHMPSHRGIWCIHAPELMGALLQIGDPECTRRGILRTAEGIHASLHHRFKRGSVVRELCCSDAFQRFVLCQETLVLAFKFAGEDVELVGF